MEREKIEAELAGCARNRLLRGRPRGDGPGRIIKEELREIKKKFDGAPHASAAAAKDLDVEDLIAEEDMVVTMTKAGYVKRIPVATYRPQKRGGKGVPAVNLKDNDYVEHLFVASDPCVHAVLLQARQGVPPEGVRASRGTRHARGTAIVNLLPLREGENISAVIATKEFPEDEFLMFATARAWSRRPS